MSARLEQLAIRIEPIVRRCGLYPPGTRSIVTTSNELSIIDCGLSVVVRRRCVDDPAQFASRRLIKSSISSSSLFAHRYRLRRYRAHQVDRLDSGNAPIAGYGLTRSIAKYGSWCRRGAVDGRRRFPPKP